MTNTNNNRTIEKASMLSPESYAFLAGFGVFILVVMTIFFIQNIRAKRNTELTRKDELRQVSAASELDQEAKVYVNTSTKNGFIPKKIVLNKMKKLKLIFQRVSTQEAHGVFFPADDSKSFVFEDGESSREVFLGPYTHNDEIVFMESEFDQKLGKVSNAIGTITIQD
jgi:hypothetical protein